MSYSNNNAKSFNLPAYINIPFFLYQDNRLDKSASLIAAFFYSLFNSGLNITASTDYLCQLAGIQKRQLYRDMNLLEKIGYIKRSGFTNRKKIEWIYKPKSSITIEDDNPIPPNQPPPKPRPEKYNSVQDLNSSAPKDTVVQELDTSVMDDIKLVSSMTLNWCHPRHTDTKEDTKDYKTTTTVAQPPPQDVNPPTQENRSSSLFFTEKQKEELLSYKIKKDDRSDETFVDNCAHHIENQENDLSKYQRYTGLKSILYKCFDMNEPFKAKGMNKLSLVPISETKTVTEDDFNNWKRGEKGYDWVGAAWRKQQS